MPAPTPQDLLALIARLEGKTLFAKPWNTPSYSSEIASRPVLRLMGLPRSDADKERGRAEMLLHGLHGRGAPLSAFVVSDGGSAFVGLSHSDLDGVANLLQAIWPEPRASRTDLPRKYQEALGRLRRAALVGGIPTPVDCHPQMPGHITGMSISSPKLETAIPEFLPGLSDALLTGMGDAPWLLWTHAEPVSSSDTEADFLQIAEEIRLASGAYLQRGTTGEDNRIARHYVDLLESMLRRFHEGMLTGMWSTGAYVATETASALLVAASIARACLGSTPTSRPMSIQPITIIPCSGEATAPVDGSVCSGFLTGAELGRFVESPLRETIGFARFRQADFDVDPASAESSDPGARDSACAVALGRIIERGRTTRHWIEIPRNDLTRHTLVVGMTGSGKTNTILHLAHQLWVDHGVPFLVLEPVKGAYRELLRMKGFEELVIFTPGDDTASPFRWNPFEFPSGVTVQSHIDHLKTVFAASFVLYPPMPYVLELSLHEVYEDRGWSLARNENRRGASDPRAYPVLGDLYEKVGEVVDRLGYEQRLAMDVQAGLRARIQSLRIGAKGAMFDTRLSFPFEELLTRPVILELRRISSDEEKAFFIGLILIRLQEHYEALSAAGKLSPAAPLAHVTVLEEAHRLLRSERRGGPAGADSADPRGQAVESFTNLLAEVRAYGEGLVIADQIPAKLAPEVLRNTNLKIVHRLSSAQDREEMAAGMLLDANQAAYAASMRVGRAIVYFEGADGSYLIEPPFVGRANPQAALPSDADIAALMAVRWTSRFGNYLHPIPSCEGCPQAGKSISDSVAALSAHSPFCKSATLFLVAILDDLPRAVEALERVHLAARSARLGLTGDEARTVVACGLLQECARQLERHGKRNASAFADLARIERLCEAVIRSWCTGGRPGEDATSALKAALLRLSERTHGPYAGCQGCASVCRYPDAGKLLALDTQWLWPEIGRQTDGEMWDETLRTEARRYLSRVQDWAPFLSGPSRRTLAGCVASHCCHDSGLPEVIQLDLVSTVRSLDV
jgi:hypothetical protein